MDQDIIKLLQRIENLENRVTVLEEKLTMNGNKENINLSSDSVSNRDKTKYVFNGKILPKNRLVFNIIKDYVNKNSSISLLDLQNVFDKSLQGSLQVVDSLSDVMLIKDYGKRYFCNDDEILKLDNGEQVVVCTQWGIFNIKKFLLVARQLGYQIDEI